MNHLSTFLLVTALSVLAIAPATAQSGAPSRPAAEGCSWERLSDAKVGLSAWVQHCDSGDSKTEFRFDQANVVQYSSNGIEPSIAIEVLDLQAGETAQQAMRRLYNAHTDAATASRCVIAPYTLFDPPDGVERYSFVPDAEYAAEPIANEDPNEAAGPLCGDWGDMPFGAQYFEVQPQSPSRNILFVRVGEYQPLFDEQTLQLLSPAASAGGAVDAMALSQDWQGFIGKMIEIGGCTLTSAEPELVMCLVKSKQGHPPSFLVDPSGMTPEDMARALRDCSFYVGYPICRVRLVGEVASAGGELKILHGSVTWIRSPQ